MSQAINSSATECAEPDCARHADGGPRCMEHSHRAAVLQCFMIDMGMTRNLLHCADGKHRTAVAELWIDGGWYPIVEVAYSDINGCSVLLVTIAKGEGFDQEKEVRFLPMDLGRHFLPLHRLVFPK